MRAVLPVAKQNAFSAGTSPSAESSEIMRRMPSGCTPEPAGRIGAEDDALELAHLARRAQRVERGALVAVVHEFERRAGSPRRCSGSPRRAARCGRR